MKIKISTVKSLFGYAFFFLENKTEQEKKQIFFHHAHAIVLCHSVVMENFLGPKGRYYAKSS